MPYFQQILLSRQTCLNRLIKVPIESSTIGWNTALRTSQPHHTLLLYSQMLNSSISPNKFTFTFLIKACNKSPSSRLVTHVHSHLIKFGFGSDPFLQSALLCSYADWGLIDLAQQVFDRSPHKDIVSWTSLVSAYAKCGIPNKARWAFDNMPERNPVSWAAVISAYSQNGCHEEALSMFDEMLEAGVVPTEGTLISGLFSSAHIGVLENGKWIHNYIDQNLLNMSSCLGTALLNMYAKCGCIDDAIRVFKCIPCKDSLAWTAMISSLAMHGRGEEALHLFDKMLSVGLKPDHVTFVGILSACSHAGLIEEGRYQFYCMKRIFNINPNLEHYGCMVDILGRNGCVEEAWNLILSMPMEPDLLVLKSLLSACAHYGHVEIAECAAERFQRLNQVSDSLYVLLANLYTSASRWDDAGRVRKMMRQRGVAKKPGCSTIEVDGVVHRFVAGEMKNYHPRIEKIKWMLREMDKALRLTTNCVPR